MTVPNHAPEERGAHICMHTRRHEIGDLLVMAKKYELQPLLLAGI